MADNNNDTIVRVKTEADTSGAEKAEKALDKVGEAAERTEKKAKSAGAETKAAGEKAAASAEKASSAFGKLGTAVKGFTKTLGYIGLAMRTVEMIVGAFNKVRDWLNRDKKAAEELARAIQDKNNIAAIEESTKAYERLKGKLAEVLRLEQERNQLADRRLSQERALEDANTELEMQRELAGLDRNDPDYQQNADLVRSKYTRIRADRTAARAEQDVRIAQERRYAQAAEKENAANELKKDIYGKSGDAVISLKGQIQDEKDAERRQKLKEQLEKLVAQQKAKLAEMKKLRDEAASIRKEAEAEMGGALAARISAEAVGVAQGAADADTRRQIEQNRQARAEAKRKEDERRAAEEAKAAAKAAQHAADEKTVSEGRKEIESLEFSAQHERDRASAAEKDYAKESAEAYEAQNRYDMLVANGGSRKEKSAALAALQKEQADAREAQHEMERVAAEVANTLQGINAQIKALASAVKKAEGRLAQNQADAPEG